MTQEYIGTKIVTAWSQEKDDVDGYAVKYEDGYVSWSPSDVFEKAYVAIGNVSHLPPFVQRVIGEKAELDDRLSKLNGFLCSEGVDKLDSIMHRLMLSQAAVMKELSDILEARLELLVPEA